MPDFNTIEEIIAELQTGRMVVLVDERQQVDGTESVGEGELIMAAELATTEAINFAMRHTGNPPVISAAKKRLELLDLDQPIPGGNSPRGAAIMAPVNAAQVQGSGVSAQDRALTARQLANSQSNPNDFIQPGHMTLLQAQPGGVLKRAGHTEAAVDLARLADFQPVALMAPILDNQGALASTSYLLDFAQQHNFKIATIKDLIAYRRHNEKLIELEATTTMPTVYGEFVVYAYRSLVDGNPYIALAMGDIANGDATLVRMHSGCLTGDALGSMLCDCGEQLHRSCEMIAQEGRGVIVYIQHHEGRGIGILHKLKAYELQRQGMDTIEANHALGLPTDARDYGIGAQVLHALGLRRVRFLTNNPQKRVGLEAYGLTVVEQVAIQVAPNRHNLQYLLTKRDKMGHVTLLKTSVEKESFDQGDAEHAEST